MRSSLILLALVVAACDTTRPEDLADPDGPIFPIAEGNTWTYTDADGGPSLVLSVGDLARVDGLLYHSLVREGSEVSDDDDFVRIAGERGVEFLYGANEGVNSIYEGITVFRYPVEETYTTRDGRLYEVTRERVTVPAGTFDVVTYSGYEGDPAISTSLAPGVGIVRFADRESVRELSAVEVR